MITAVQELKTSTPQIKLHERLTGDKAIASDPSIIAGRLPYTNSVLAFQQAIFGEKSGNRELSAPRKLAVAAKIV